MGASLRFYRLLDLDIPEPAAGDDFVQVITPNGYRISWNKLEMVKELDPHWVEPAGQRIGLAFKCASPAEVDAAYARIIAAGYKSRTAPWDAYWRQRYAVVEDPDGNAVDLFAPME
ncbi:MAG: VOC family protein, partial [Anaerolineales bacterium]